MKTLNKDRWSPDQDLNLGPPEYEAGVLTTRPRSSTSVVIKYKLLHSSSHLIKHHAITTYGGVMAQLHAFLSSELNVWR
jgi:hypothetical protein